MAACDWVADNWARERETETSEFDTACDAEEVEIPEATKYDAATQDEEEIVDT